MKKGLLGEALNQVGSVVKQTAKTVVKAPVGLVDTVESQLGGKRETQVGSNRSENSQPQSNPQETQKFIDGLYGAEKSQETVPDQAGNLEELKTQQALEDRQKLQKLRVETHNETYYQPLVAPPKAPEERSAEKVEREVQEDRVDLQKKQAKKPQPLSVEREMHKTERQKVVSG